MNKKLSSRVICLVIAATVLVGALTVSALNGSPYENLKNAAFNTLFVDNMSYEGELTMHINGQLQEREWVRGVHTREGTMSVSQSMDGSERLSFFNGEVRLNTTFGTTHDNNVWYNIHRVRWFNEDEWFNSLGYDMFGVEDRSATRLRFTELLIDLVVGDLKNNLTMNNQGDGMRRVSGAITESQLPEIVRVLMDMIIEETYNSAARRNRTREDYANMWDAPVRSISINRIHGNADINSDDILVYVSGGISLTIENMFGEVYTMDVAGSMRFTDIGSSVLESPIPGLLELFTYDFITETFGVAHQTVHFTLNSDGTVNENSLTTRWPSRW